MEGEVNLGMIWNGSAFVARRAGTPIDVVWPKEGGIFWMDSWRSRQMPKQRRRTEIDQLPAAPDVQQNRLLKLSVIQRQTCGA